MRYIISSVLSMLPLTAMAEVPRVITDIPPVYGLVAMVMGDLGAPVLLLEQGASAHDFQLRPSQMSDIASADLAVWIGPQLTPWMERALAGGGGEMTSLPLLGVEGTYLQEFGAKDAHDHDHDHDHSAEDSAEDDHAHSGTDPHAWLDPSNAAPWLDAIAAALSQRDPENAATYSANAAAAQVELAALEGEIAAALAPIKDKGFVAYHDAYGYFAAHYDLAYKGAVALGDATSAGAAHLRKVQETLAEGVVCVFPEGQHDSSLLVQLTEGTPAKAGAALDPEGAMLAPARSNYADVLRNLTAALTGCLSGA